MCSPWRYAPCRRPQPPMKAAAEPAAEDAAADAPAAEDAAAGEAAEPDATVEPGTAILVEPEIEGEAPVTEGEAPAEPDM